MVSVAVGESKEEREEINRKFIRQIKQMHQEGKIGDAELTLFLESVLRFETEVQNVESKRQ